MNILLMNISMCIFSKQYYFVFSLLGKFWKFLYKLLNLFKKTLAGHQGKPLILAQTIYPKLNFFINVFNFILFCTKFKLY